MKKIATVVMAVLLVGVLLISSTGCVSKEKYDALKAENQALSENVTRLTAELAKAPKPLRNPTYAELMTFLAQDTTDKNKYPGPYFTGEYARDLRVNAQKAGFRAGTLRIITKERTFYANVFETTDKGRIYWEPEMEKELSLKLNESYFLQNGWRKPFIDDTLVKIQEPPDW